MRLHTPPIRLVPDHTRSPTPHSAAWSRALSDQADASRRAILARQALDELEARMAGIIEWPNDAAMAADMTRWRHARHQLYRSLHALIGFQAHVMDLAHGDRILEADDVETGLPIGIVEDLAAALCRDEDGGR